MSVVLINTKINETFTIDTVNDARQFVKFSRVDHYEIWEHGRLIEFGRTPTRRKPLEHVE